LVRIVTEIPDLLARRAAEQSRIRKLLNAMRAEEEAKLKGGEDAVAWVKEELCIGCDQCTIVCDDDAIELYDTPMASPIMDVEVNRKAKILRDECTGCRLCALGCPTDAIIMIDR
jgi:electron transport complex protein RnfB|tara:strand:- start:156 stop:500 length:345 start_codon:yes stop_codon:yes gene_type:complete